jgi:hypothetical protein
MAGPWPAQSVSWDRCLSNRFWLRQPLPVSDKQLLWQKIRSRLNFTVLGRFNQALTSNAPIRTLTRKWLGLARPSG